MKNKIPDKILIEELEFIGSKELIKDPGLKRILTKVLERSLKRRMKVWKSVDKYCGVRDVNEIIELSERQNKTQNKGVRLSERVCGKA